MPEYVVKCPVCKKQYKVTPNNPATFAQNIFTCRNCRFTAPFHSLIKELAPAPSPQPVTHSEGTGIPHVTPQAHSATKVSPGINAGVPQMRAYLTVMGNNARFVLNQGIYILGRKSSDSTATLQLAPDISMSRQQARLAVQVVNGKLMAQITSLKADNPVFVNGKICPAGQPCMLKLGDQLQLGMTRVVFSI